MDTTNVFRECVALCQERNQDLNSGARQNLSQRLGSRLKKRSHLNSKCLQLVQNITHTKSFLLANRNNYINIYSALMSQSSRMTDTERDQIDQQMHQFTQTCLQLLKSLKQEIPKEVRSKEELKHMNAVVDIICNYLRSVCDIHSEMKAIRIKRVFERQKMSRLETSLPSKSSLDRAPQSSGNQESIDGSRQTTDDSHGDPTRQKDDLRSEIPRQKKEEFSEPEVNLDPEEELLLAQENAQMYDEMTSMVDEVKQIESKVVEIARLQELFTEKVLEQEEDLNKLNQTVVGSTENIKDGNEFIREAMKKNAGLRVWVLFFIIVLSFTVLFLDWYNP